jgi:beta-lactam-binding protein with PASTA domain
MRLPDFFKKNTLGVVLANLALAFIGLLVIGILYFYIFLPNTTCHDCSVTVPDVTGMKLEEIETFLVDHDLRYEVEDSVYHGEYPPLTVMRQFPKPGSIVKPNRTIYVSINPVMPPMVPMPDLANPSNTTSRIGAEAILRSNGLKRGRILQRPHVDLNLVLEMRYKGTRIAAGTRIPKGSVIDLVVGDGNGPNGFALGSLLNDRYQTALFKLQGWDLRLGEVFLYDGADTTGGKAIVYKQYPPAGDSVRTGDAIDLYISDKIPEDELQEPDDNDKQ